MRIEKVSHLTGKSHVMNIPITDTQLKAVEAREMPIQILLPNLPAPQREFLISGITPEEWEEAFGSLKEDK